MRKKIFQGLHYMVEVALITIFQACLLRLFLHLSTSSAYRAIGGLKIVDESYKQL